MLQTIKKVSVLLALFDREHTEWGVRAVAQKLRVPRSTAHDLLSSLAESGLLTKTKEGRYRLGWRLVGLSEIMLATNELRREAHPIMEELSERYDETIHLAVLDDTKVVYVDKLEGKQGTHVDITSLGTRMYAHCSAVGKVLLAYRPEMQVQRIIQIEGLPRFTPNTITGELELRQTLVNVSKQGYAYDLEEIVPNLCCVGSLIRDYTENVVGAISISVNKERFRRSHTEFQQAVVRSARAISGRLGHYGR